MDVPDLVNGSFECLGGFAILQSIRRVLKDKQVKGVSVLHVAFFSLWGFWNLYYYPSLGQSLSFWGGVLVTVANTTWVCLLVYCSRHPKGEKK